MLVKATVNGYKKEKTSMGCKTFFEKLTFIVRIRIKYYKDNHDETKKESWIGKSSDNLRAGMVKMCQKYNMDYDYSVKKC